MWEYDTLLVGECINQKRIKQSPQQIKNSNHVCRSFSWKLICILFSAYIGDDIGELEGKFILDIFFGGVLSE